MENRASSFSVANIPLYSRAGSFKEFRKVKISPKHQTTLTSLLDEQMLYTSPAQNAECPFCFNFHFCLLFLPLFFPVSLPFCYFSRRGKTPSILSIQDKYSIQSFFSLTYLFIQWHYLLPAQKTSIKDDFVEEQQKTWQQIFSGLGGRQTTLAVVPSLW